MSRYAEILKLVPSTRDSNSQNFSCFTRQNFYYFFLNVVYVILTGHYCSFVINVK